MPSKSSRKGSTSSTLSSSSTRPSLMRASATAPSLATSNASRQDYSTLQSSRATALLTRVASYSLGHGYEHNASRSSSICSSPDQSPVGARKNPYEMVNSSNYYSFPSFEESQEYPHHQERRP